MRAPLWERILRFLCSLTGHWGATGSTWNYLGQQHAFCRLCGKIYSKPEHKGNDDGR